jgi:hypothetical protein
MTRLGIREVEARNRAEPESQLRDTLPLTGSPHGKTEPKKSIQSANEGQYRAKADLEFTRELYPADFRGIERQEYGVLVGEVALPKWTQQSNRWNE